MLNSAVDDEHVSAAAAYVGRVSVGGSFRSEKAVLLVTNAGLAFHRQGRFEKYRAIPYEEINSFDLRRRWNGMVLSIGANGEEEFHFRFFRPRGDLAAIVVSLNQRLQSNERPLRPRYALTQVSTEADESDREPPPKSTDSQAAFEQPSSDTTPFASETPDQPPALRADQSRYGPVGKRSGSATRVFAGDRANFAPLIRALPKLIIFCLALYSVVVSGLWEKGIDTIAGWLSVPSRHEAATRPVTVEEPSLSEVSDPPSPAEDNLTHVRIDLSEYPDLAELLETQRAAMNMSRARAAEEAHLDPSMVERIESATEVVTLTDFLKYAKAIHLNVRTVRDILDR